MWDDCQSTGELLNRTARKRISERVKRWLLRLKSTREKISLSPQEFVSYLLGQYRCAVVCLLTLIVIYLPTHAFNNCPKGRAVCDRHLIQLT